MKKLIITALCVAISNSYALSKKEERILRHQKILAEMGLELVPAGTVEIAPVKSFMKNIASTESATRYLKMHQEQIKNGYVKENNPRAEELLNHHLTAKATIAKNVKRYDPVDTELKGHIEEMKMAYTFVGVPHDVIDSDNGVAAYGAYKQIKHGDEGDGWDGAVQFFDNNQVGSCAFYEHNKKLAGTGVKLMEEMVTYDVKNKPTVLLTTGSDLSGYVYKVTWYSLHFERTLECANKNFSPEIKEKVITLANKIEENQ
jgi:hypothetical protein